MDHRINEDVRLTFRYGICQVSCRASIQVGRDRRGLRSKRRDGYQWKAALPPFMNEVRVLGNGAEDFCLLSQVFRQLKADGAAGTAPA
jgi:hypothetical protein